MFEKTIASHLCRPRGLVGRLVAWEMSAKNRTMNELSVASLDIRAGHRVLDAGFGGGATLPLMASRSGPGDVFGLDVSDTMLRQARRRYRSLIDAGRLNLVKGSIEAMPFPDGYFDRVCSVNTIYFLRDPAAAGRELWRVLQPAGLLAVTYRPAEGMRRLGFVRHGFTVYEEPAVSGWLRGAGFVGIASSHREDGFLGCICTVARKPADRVLVKRRAVQPAATRDLV